MYYSQCYKMYNLKIKVKKFKFLGILNNLDAFN